MTLLVELLATSPAHAASGGTISGTVRSEAGIVPGVWVSAEGPQYVSVLVGDDGTYSITDLMPGDYRVRFDTSIVNQGEGPDYASEYYDGTASSEAATLLTVTEGATLTGIDATLDPAASISGTVTAQDGTPLAGVFVSASSGSGGYGSSQTDAEGKYTVTGLAAGDYRVQFDTSALNQGDGPDYSSEYYDGTASYDAATALTVGPAATLTDINATLDPAASISGTVTAQDGTPLADVSVNASNGAGGYGSSQTDAEGRYTVTGLAPGDYRVQFETSTHNQGEGPDYMAEYYDGTSSYDAATLLNVTAGATITDINATLDPAASVSGTVTAQDGTPLADVYVNASTTSGGYAWAQTDAEGTYNLTGLAPGDYRIQFDTSLRNQGEGPGYVSEYYNGTTAFEKATLLTVNAGATLSGIDATLDPAASISGTVTAQDGTPLADVYVSASNDAGAYGLARTDAEGRYTVTGLAPGDYRVWFETSSGNQGEGPGYMSEYYDGTPSYDAATLLTLTAGATLTGIDATLDPASSVSGTVTAQDGTPLADIYVSASNDAGGYRSAQTDAEGRYTITGLAPGEYRVRFDASTANQGDGPFYASEYYDNASADAAATLVSVANGQAVTGINAILEAAGSIAGVVRGDDAVPLEGVLVRAYSDDGLSEGSATTKADGSYVINGLAPVLHRVSFSPSALNNESGTDYLFQLYRDQTSSSSADLVPVRNGEVTSGIDATLGHSGSIAGTVTTPDGTPIAGISVVADGPDGAFGYGTTADDGTYVITDLLAGDYLVSFDGGPAHFTGGPNYAHEYYNDVTDYTKATLVTVAAGQRTPSIDAALVTTTVEQTGTISGTVYGPDGKTPLAGISIGTSGPSGDGGFAAVTDADGKYSLTLGAGMWVVSYNTEEYNRTHDLDLRSELYDNAIGFTNATSIPVVAGGETSGIDVVLDPLDNRAPVLDAIADQSVDALSPLTLTATGTDPDSQPLTYSLGAGAPEGAAITTAGAFSWTPSQAQAPGTYPITVTVSDGTLTDSVVFNVTVREPVVTLTPGQPTIAGTAALGNTLTADPGTWQPGAVSFTYQWYRGDSPIEGATASTYTVQAGDVGSALLVKVTGTLTGYPAATASSAPTAVVPAANPADTFQPATPMIKGPVKVGSALTADPRLAKWAPLPTSVTYQWSRVCSGTSTAIADATAAEYVVQAADGGCSLTVTVTGSGLGYPPVEAVSKPTRVVKLGPMK